MFYIRTADRLVRTAPWIESFAGGIEKLRRIILQDELGICRDLEAEMQFLVDSYEDEWKLAVDDVATRAKFRQFVNTVSSPPRNVQADPGIDDIRRNDRLPLRGLRSVVSAARQIGPRRCRRSSSLCRTCRHPRRIGAG